MSSLSCTICDKDFSTFGSLRRHQNGTACQKGVVKKERLSCPDCRRVFTALSSLQYHQSKKVCQRKHHNSNTVFMSDPVVSSSSSPQGDCDTGPALHFNAEEKEKVTPLIRAFQSMLLAQRESKVQKTLMSRLTCAAMTNPILYQLFLKSKKKAEKWEDIPIEKLLSTERVKCIVEDRDFDTLEQLKAGKGVVYYVIIVGNLMWQIDQETYPGDSPEKSEECLNWYLQRVVSALVQRKKVKQEQRNLLLTEVKRQYGEFEGRYNMGAKIYQMAKSVKSAFCNLTVHEICQQLDLPRVHLFDQ